jgi:tRNA (guanine37-N1)-methyltransferase
MPVTAIRFDVLTLFPDLFQSYFAQSLMKHAIDSGRVTAQTWNIRNWATGKHQSVDDRPFGGGPGMVLMPEPVVACVEAVQAVTTPPGQLVMLTPAGHRLTQQRVQQLAELPRLVLLCGRYEGFDDRIRAVLQPLELSVGDYVCNGGEVPAMMIMDTVMRLIPGVLGDEQSAVDDSHSEIGRLEFPQYTRPRVFRGLEVPAVLLSGNHPAIAKWRAGQSRQRSLERYEPAPDGGRGDDPHAKPSSGPG